MVVFMEQVVSAAGACAIRPKASGPLLQNKTPIEPRDIHGSPLFDDGGFIGAEVWHEYDAKAVRSEDAAVEVLTPDG
jgi:hypothetical protein